MMEEFPTGLVANRSFHAEILTFHDEANPTSGQRTLMTLMFWPVVIFMAISLAIGLYTYTQVRGSSKRYTVCEGSMPFILVGTALVAQAIDGNATLGSASMTYGSGIWAGLAIPIGLALSLFIVGRFLAAPLNRMKLLTLPEFFYRRYGKATELLVSILTMISFTVVVAGNLSAVAWILAVVSGFEYLPSLLVVTLVIMLYTMAGGLYAAIWTDFLQIHVAIAGFVLAAGWLLGTRGWESIVAAIPPKLLDASGIATLEGGGLVNWSFIIALAFGNAMALDFMERVFAAKSPEVAQRSCYYAGALTVLVGLCGSILGIAAISTVSNAADPRMVLPTLAANSLPYWIGVLVFTGIVGASMSTANGAMLVISVVMARSVLQRWRGTTISDRKMLLLSRLLAIPAAATAAWVAYVRPEPGVLLVVAFDIVFAGCVVPLFLGVYWQRANAAGAISSIAVGTSARIACHFLVPPPLMGLETLVPPVLSGLTFVAVCLLTEPGVAREARVIEAPDQLVSEGTEG
jgi:Na+/proline symporter